MKLEKIKVIGWREWVSLPELGIPSIKAKVDTGARSSSLHAYEVKIFRSQGKRMVRFKVHPEQQNYIYSVVAEAELIEERNVRSSGGHETLRPVIKTAMELGGERVTIEVTLASRDSMGFRMLLGRQAIKKLFLVNPAKSFMTGRPLTKKKIKRRTGK